MTFARAAVRTILVSIVGTACGEPPPSTEHTSDATDPMVTGAPDGTTTDGSVIVSAGGQATTADGEARLSLGVISDTTVTDGLHHQVIEGPDGVAEVMLRFDASVGDDGLQFEFAYEAGTAEFAIGERGFMTIVEGGQAFLATQGDVRIAVLAEQQLRLEFIGVSAGKFVPTMGTFEQVHPVGNGFVEGTVERACQYFESEFAEDGVHNSDGTPSRLLRDDPTWSSDFCAPYAHLMQ